MNKLLKARFNEFLWAAIATIVGAAIIQAGLYLLNVRLDVFYGISTFGPSWVLAVFLLPFIAGIVVSVIYGLGGKIIAHFSPIMILLPQYLLLDTASLPEGVTQLPIGYWLLVLILSVEFCSLGGIVGEVAIKKTYGRRPKHLIHKRYQVTLKQKLFDSNPIVQQESSGPLQ